MSEDRPRLALPRRVPLPAHAAASAPRVVTPDYGDEVMRATSTSTTGELSQPAAQSRQRQTDPFEGFGERLGSRPLALRLPRPIDLAIRQIAAEQQVQPLRIVDQAIRDYLEKHGRLPERPDAPPRS